MRDFKGEELGPEADETQRDKFMERKDKNKKRREKLRQSRGSGNENKKKLLNIEDYDHDSSFSDTKDKNDHTIERSMKKRSSHLNSEKVGIDKNDEEPDKLSNAEEKFRVKKMTINIFAKNKNKKA